MWTFAAYGLVRWAFVESWKDSIKRNVSSTVNVTSEDAYEFLRQSGAARKMVNGQSFNIEPREQCQRIEQVLEYFARVRESLERCGIINTTVIKSVAADESLVIPSNVIRITPVVNEPGSVIDIRHLHGYQNHRNPQDTAVAKQPRTRSGSWSKEEDAILIELVRRYGPINWSQIASQLPDRGGRQCRERCDAASSTCLCIISSFPCVTLHVIAHSVSP